MMMNILDIYGISRFMPLTNQQLVISKSNKEGLFLIDSDGNNETVLVEDFPAESLYHWTVTATNIYYRDIRNDLGIWKINATTLDKIKVSDSYPSSVGRFLSVDRDHGRILITKTDKAESDIFIADY
jgi:Tol biopolymer transport system component